MAEKDWLCDNCGAQNESGRERCVVCGSRIPAVVTMVIPSGTDGGATRRRRCLRLATPLAFLAAWLALGLNRFGPDHYSPLPKGMADNGAILFDFIRMASAKIVRELRYFRFSGLGSIAVQSWGKIVRAFSDGIASGINIMIGLALSSVWLARLCVRKHACVRRRRGTVLPLVFEMPAAVMFFCCAYNYLRMDTNVGYALWRGAAGELFLAADIGAILALLVLLVWKICRNAQVKGREIILLSALILVQTAAVYGLY